MNKQLASIFILSAALVRPSYSLPSGGNTSSSGRRSGRSRAGMIAGIVVGVLALLFILSLCCCIMARRRRTRRNMTTGPGVVESKQQAAPSRFGGLWGRSNGMNNGQTAPMGAHPNHTANAAQPGLNAAAPPPTYGQEAEYGHQFAAPSGPPPAAHTAGKENGFMGGFRS